MVSPAHILRAMPPAPVSTLALATLALAGGAWVGYAVASVALHRGRNPVAWAALALVVPGSVLVLLALPPRPT